MTSARLLTPNNLKTIKFELAGFEEYLEKIARAGNNVEAYTAKAIEESAKPVLADIEKWADKHKLTGATRKGVAASDLQQDGGKFSVDVGVDSERSEYAWHAVFVEFGTPNQPADPGIRRAFSQNKAKVRKIQKEILAKGGIPTG